MICSNCNIEPNKYRDYNHEFMCQICHTYYLTDVHGKITYTQMVTNFKGKTYYYEYSLYDTSNTGRIFSINEKTILTVPKNLSLSQFISKLNHFLAFL